MATLLLTNTALTLELSNREKLQCRHRSLEIPAYQVRSAGTAGPDFWQHFGVNTARTKGMILAGSHQLGDWKAFAVWQVGTQPLLIRVDWPVFNLLIVGVADPDVWVDAIVGALDGVPITLP